MNLWGNVLHQHIIPSAKNAYRPHLLRPSWLGFFVALILAAEGFLMTNLIVRQTNESFLAAVVPGEVIALTNMERSKEQVSPVTQNTALTAAAQSAAHTLATNGSISNTSPWDSLTRAGYNYRFVGENIAVNFVDTKDVVKAWMASPSHKSTLLQSTYTQVGVGVANGTYEGQPATFVVQYLATPLSQTATVAGAPIHTFWQLFAHLQSEPLSTTQWVLGSIVLVLSVLLLITFFKEIHIQSTHLLITAGSVCTVALVLLLCNGSILEGTNIQGQSASVFIGSQGIQEGTVLIPTFATSTERG